jgi:ABC-type phosphate transport system substrate-binding protein
LGEGNRYTVSVIAALFLLALCQSCDGSQDYLDASDSMEEALSVDIILESTQPVAVIQQPPVSGRSTVQEDENVLRVACMGWARQLLVDQVRPGFESSHPGYQIHLFNPRADQGLEELVRGNLDLMLSSKVLTYAQKRQGLRQQPFSRRTWVPVVNKTNPLFDLSKAQVGQILDGRTQSWSSLGRQLADIETFILDKVEPGQREAWQSLFPGLAPEPKGRREESWIQVVSQVSQMAGAIALIPMEAAQSPSIKVLSVDGKRATHQALVQQTYPLSFDIYVTYSIDGREQALMLKDYVMQSRAILAGPGR